MCTVNEGLRMSKVCLCKASSFLLNFSSSFTFSVCEMGVKSFIFHTGQHSTLVSTFWNYTCPPHLTRIATFSCGWNHVFLNIPVHAAVTQLAKEVVWTLHLHRQTEGDLQCPLHTETLTLSPIHLLTYGWTDHLTNELMVLKIHVKSWPQRCLPSALWREEGF